ncbi:MAG: redox-regulated ATPase YchF [Lachnospiraceae bacterium]|nr:redox-regulated ATPase YchF [Lachnospiraceae bacterium]
MKLGIVGLPNVGKSTLFNAITGTANAQAANYPFCTIEPNTGIVAVPDERLDKLAEIWETNKKTPAVVEFVDIAGLVKGASQGAGLGNKFLGHIRECDAIIHVVRCFDDDNITHVVEDATKPAPVDPDGDIECIDLELIMSDLEMAQNRLNKHARAAKTGNKEAKAELLWLEPLIEHLGRGQSARTFEFDEKDDAQQLALKELGLLSMKPIIYACNMDDDGAADPESNEYYQIVKKRADVEGAQVIAICAKTEEDLAELDEEEKAEFMADLGLSESGLNRLIKASYELLGLISFLTDGKKECRAWTIKKGTKAPQAAGKIHSDFERGFIRAQVIGFEDLKAADYDYAAVRSRGQQRTEGKEYIVKDGDVIEFLFNV